MGYLLANAQYMLDTDCWEFVKIDKTSQPMELEVPYYFYNYAKSVFVYQGWLWKTYMVSLNNLSIEFVKLDRPQEEHPIFGYYNAILKFFVKGEWQTWTIVVSPSYGNINYNNLKATELRRVYYDVFKDMVEVKTCVTDFFGTADENLPRFHQIRSLALVRPNASAAKDRPCYGIHRKPWSVFYKGKELNGKSYAMLCGTWAILLGDDFSFDSIVTLDGVEDGKLSVDRVIYSINPYIVKIVMLAG